jgi:NAD(P)H-hydrate epimerase
LVIDADALNSLSQLGNWWEFLPKDAIITPHPGEMARLTGFDTQQINANRWQIATEMAHKWQVVVVLKGAHTIVASPDGQVGVVPFKTDALGTAGTGDVLAGLIAGFRTQGASAFDSAIIGVYCHALAGIIASQQVGHARAVIAGDVLDALGHTFAQIEGLT